MARVKKEKTLGQIFMNGVVEENPILVLMLGLPRGGVPVGPMVIFVHIASVWVPFTSESKEAIAHYPEIIKEIHDAGRKVSLTLSDSFCVDRHRAEFLDLAEGRVDVLFANEAEICSGRPSCHGILLSSAERASHSAARDATRSSSAPCSTSSKPLVTD